MQTSSSLADNDERLPGGEKTADATRAAVEGVGKAANYVRDRDLQGMISDLKEVATKHPGPVLLAAAAVGFLLTRALSRRE